MGFNSLMGLHIFYDFLIFLMTFCSCVCAFPEGSESKDVSTNHQYIKNKDVCASEVLVTTKVMHHSGEWLRGKHVF